MAGRQLKVEIVGDASSLQRALGSAGKSTQTLGSHFKSLAKYAGIAAGAAGIGAVFVSFKRGFAEMSESQRVMSQTEAGLKSTGHAANVTAKEVTDLASAQSKLTGIDDETIQAGENMLLTFTNIRNEVGKGNDIFNQSTVALEDMATRMANGAVPSAEQLSSSAIRLGKALNDPIKGMGALSRVGVQFDKDQAKAITTMVKSGDTMGAQKLILAELTKEFGGSAKAAGETFPGQLAKLKNAFDEAAGSLVTQMLPYLTRFVEFVNQNMPTIQATMDTVARVISEAFKTIGTVVDAAAGPVKGFVDFLRGSSVQSQAAADALLAIAPAIVVIVGAIKAWTAAQLVLNAVTEANPWVLLATALVALGAALVVAYTRSETFRKIVNDTFTSVKNVVLPIIETLREAWDRWGADIIAIAKRVMGILRPTVEAPLRALFSFIQGIVAIFQGDWSRAWDKLSQVPLIFLRAAVNMIRGIAGLYLDAARYLGAQAVAGIVAGLKALPGAVTSALQAIPGIIRGMAATAYSLAVGIGRQLIQGVLDGLSGLAGAVKAKAEGMLHSALSSLNPFSSVEHGGQIYIGEPIVRGAIRGLEQLQSTFNEKTADAVRNAVTAAADAVKAGQGKFADAWSGYSDAALSVFDKIASQVQTKSEKALGSLEAAHAKAQVIGAVSEARTGLAEAQAGGDQAAIVAAQKTLDDALYAQKVYGLQQRAAAERADLDARTENARVKFETWLSTRNAQQQVELAKEGAGQAAIIAKIKSYNPLYHQRGLEIGAALARGLEDQRGWVRDAALALANEIASALGIAESARLSAKGTAERLDSTVIAGRRALGGPVAIGKAYLVGEKGPELFVPGMAGAIVPNLATPSIAAAGASGGALVFNFPNYVGSREELIREVRAGLADVARDNPNIFAGRA